MKIVSAKPPNYAEIDAVFGPLPEGVVFTYGDTVYCSPRGISDHVQIHEAVHVRQQAVFPGGADGWWSKYLKDKDFRLKQELEAYRAQYDYVCRTRGRSERRELLNHFVSSLAAPMYGRMISKKNATIALRPPKR